MGKGGRSSTDRERPPGHNAGPAQDAAEGAGALLSNPAYAPFTARDFNAAEFTSKVLAASRTSAAAHAEQLRAGVRALEAGLHAHVLDHHITLLAQARSAADAEAALQDVVRGVEVLQAAAARVRTEIQGPYAAVAQKTRQLSHLHATIDLLRQLTHRLKLISKLRAQLAAPAPSLDLAKAAKLLTDVRQVGANGELDGLDAVAADAAFLDEAGRLIHEQAQAALAEGMESLSQAKVGGALQVFFNMEQLQQAVDQLLSKHLHEVERAFKAALDARHLGISSGVPGGGGPGGVRGLATPAPAAGASWQDKLWQGLRAAAEQLQASVVAVWHLQRVVAKKRDPLSHVCFLDVLCGPGQPLPSERFWSDLMRALGEVCSHAARTKSGLIRETLTFQYPRFAALLESAFEKLQTDTTLKGVLPAVADQGLAELLGATAAFRDGYLAASLARLSEVVGAAFGGGARALPSPADVQKCIGCMHEELKACSSSPQTCTAVAGVVGKALRMMGDKAEYSAASAQELRPLGVGAATPAQLRNIALCSQLQEVHRSLVALLPRLPTAAAAALKAPLDGVQGTAIELAAPMFRAQMEALEVKVGTMHSLAWGGDGSEGGMTDTSRYMDDIAQSVSHFRAEFLSKFVPPPSPSVPSCVSSLAERMAARLLSVFVRHAALLRPLGATGKLQLAKDMGELQLAVAQGLCPLEQLGPPAQVLRAFRALLFLEDAQIIGSPLLRELPQSIVLHHLFSRLPAGIQAPHERSGLTPAQYSHWLDQHSADDVARSVKGALEAAKGSVQLEPRAAELFGAMLRLCSKER